MQLQLQLQAASTLQIVPQAVSVPVGPFHFWYLTSDPDLDQEWETDRNLNQNKTTAYDNCPFRRHMETAVRSLPGVASSRASAASPDDPLVVTGVADSDGVAAAPALTTLPLPPADKDDVRGVPPKTIGACGDTRPSVTAGDANGNGVAN